MTDTELHYTLFIATTPEKVWAAITTPEFTRQYWGGHINVSDWKQGSRWQHKTTDGDSAVRIAGKVLESAPPHRLVISWFAPDNEAEVSRVSFEINPAADAVRLDVTHSGLKDGSAMASGVSNGWPVVLSSLKSWLETGKGLDMMAVLGKHACDSKTAAA